MLSTASSKTGLVLIIGLITALFFSLTLSQAKAEAPQSPDDVVIKSSIWKTKKYEDTKLSHKKHAEDYKIQCDQCHHVYKEGKNVFKAGDKVQKCEECHNVAKTGKALREASPEEKKLSLYNAFHDNCKACHKKEQKGPVKCMECHPKKPK